MMDPLQRWFRSWASLLNRLIKSIASAHSGEMRGSVFQKRWMQRLQGVPPAENRVRCSQPCFDFITIKP